MHSRSVRCPRRTRVRLSLEEGLGVLAPEIDEGLEQAVEIETAVGQDPGVLADRQVQLGDRRQRPRHDLAVDRIGHTEAARPGRHETQVADELDVVLRHFLFREFTRQNRLDHPPDPSPAAGDHRRPLRQVDPSAAHGAG